jgi:GNAT superfamily N-acetyltransferase
MSPNRSITSPSAFFSVDKTSQIEKFSQELLESDRVYFEAGASIHSIPNGSVTIMDGLSHIPAGCIVQRIDEYYPANAWDEWLTGVEVFLSQFSGITPRLYLDKPIPACESTFKKRGYRPQIEVGLIDIIVANSEPEEDIKVSLRPVITEMDWQLKVKLHASVEKGPDGHLTPAKDWVNLERRKCESGKMRTYFICVENEICGSVGAIELEQFLRLKNLVIDPAWQGQGLGQAAVRAMRNEAIHNQKLAFGCFALQGGIGQHVYRRAGLTVVTQQTEWYYSPSVEDV